MQTKVVSTGFVPRPTQMELHRESKRFNVIVAHRRFGKTFYETNRVLDKAIRNPLEAPQYAYLAPYRDQAKRVVWDYFKRFIGAIPGAQINEAELRIDVPRNREGKPDRLRFMLLGADSPDALRGIYLDGAILDEYAQMNPLAWSEVIRPALSDRTGWADFIGTPKGKNNFYDLHKYAESNTSGNWFTKIYKASETGILSAAELKDMRDGMDEDTYLQEFECSFASGIHGAYYAKQIEKAEASGNMTEVPYDVNLPCFTYWDLGLDDSTAIWSIQPHGYSFRVIDYYESNGFGLDHYADVLKKRGYNYEAHVFPHDIAVKELSSGVSRIETARGLGLFPLQVAPRLKVEDGINAVRGLISKCYFDSKRCVRGVEALKMYQRKWDPKAMVFSNTPLHNQYSHGADAFRTFAVVSNNYDPARLMRNRDLPREADLSWSPYG